MISVLANKSRRQLPGPRRRRWACSSTSRSGCSTARCSSTRTTRCRREIVGLGQSRRTESYWTRTTLTDVDTGRAAAEVLLHSGVFKESYPGYPKDRLG